ncbi:hypothetical protein BJ508DRAFT_327978 [Ascobolus immersus RN42]|uniref:ATPase synthesis protein 25 n=1 Tax=Ascobolus immersus RN42 TaxID=1160509 RepID=A0A3N4IDB0_ASCIM|nr:hypothetical protein BJ508DRAFT_327978 [Ascobolus immersus RN42]
MSARTARAVVNALKAVSSPAKSLTPSTPLRASITASDRPIGLSSQLSIRTFTSSSKTSDNLTEHSTPDNASIWDTVPISASSDAAPTTTTAPSKPASAPWYLNVKPKTDKYKSPLHQPLPKLPENPPTFLAPILEHLDNELGITSLNLLDLRPISSERPLSLGSKLIMLFGTARSERHLHIAADKLCRFLRQHYDLTPHADGLLGRNEIKLRERRKRRRGKIGISQGAETTEDEKIGWVCVNTGEGVGIVVQLFTKERREELDLEGLWKGIKDREMNRLRQLTAGEEVQEVDLMEEAIKVEEEEKRAKAERARLEKEQEEEEEFDNSDVVVEKPKPRWMETATTSKKLAFKELKLKDLKEFEDKEEFDEEDHGELRRR